MSQASLDSQHVADYVRHQTLFLQLAVMQRSANPDARALASAMTVQDDIRARIEAREAAEPHLAAPALIARLGLTLTEQHVLWL